MYNFIRIAAIAIGTLVAAIGGVMFMTASADVAKKEKAKYVLSYVVMGLMVIVVAPTAVQYIIA